MGMLAMALLSEISEVPKIKLAPSKVDVFSFPWRIFQVQNNRTYDAWSRTQREMPCLASDNFVLRSPVPSVLASDGRSKKLPQVSGLNVLEIKVPEKSVCKFLKTQVEWILQLWKSENSRACWYLPTVPAFRSQKQENQEFKVSLGYTYLKTSHKERRSTSVYYLES